MDSGPGRRWRQTLSSEVRCPVPETVPGGHPGIAVSPSTPGRRSPASGASSEIGLAPLSYWERSIPHAQTSLYPWGGCPNTPPWSLRGRRPQSTA